jgi:hypothetical protein
MTAKQKKYKQQKALSQVLFGLSLLFLLLALTILAWAVWPNSSDSAQLSIPAGPLPGAPEGSGFSSQAAYTLTLDWPDWLRKGQAGELRASLEEENAPEGREPQVVLIEPALVGLALDPPGLVQANPAAGQDLVETWQFDTRTAGDFSGKVYVSFGFYDKEQEELIAVPVAVVDIALRITSVWGLSNQLALWIGLVALAFWGALFILGRVVRGDAR